ncbi:MAG: hemerythrin domain-containing protein [Rhodocyclaceae bacterium]|nr:hemerythrin domain-containing protein [Rhodocyclaceae bacterium]
MKNEIARLRMEHGNFRKLLDLLEAQLYLFHKGEQPDYSLMTDILHYMTHYPDGFHHPKEDVIFSYLLERDPGAAPSVEELARQHHVIAESGARLHENLQSVIAGTMMPRKMVEAPGLQYVTYYRTHMDTEESDLFLLAERLLRDDDWKKINDKVLSESDPMFGASIEERYCAVYNHIAQANDGGRAS